MVEKDFFKDATLGDIFTKEMIKEFALIMEPLIMTKLIEEARKEGAITELKCWLNDMKETMMRTNTSYSGIFWADKIAKRLKELGGETK